MEVKRRLIVVGLGSIGRRHARLLKERPDVIVEVVESSPEALSAAIDQFGPLTSYPKLEDALATRPDFAWIATPTSLHEPQTIASLEAGCHVFCEKPMSDSLASARRMKEVADGSRRLLNIGFHLHFWEGAVRMKRLLDSGALGNVLHAHARVGSYITLVNSQSRYQASCPGSLFLDYSHQPDLFYWLFGAVPRHVRADAFQAGSLEFSSDPNVADILCRYDSALRTTIHLNYVQMPECHDYEIVGDEGWVHADMNAGRVTSGCRRTREVETWEFAQDKDAMVRGEQQAFFDAVEGTRPPSTSAADGLVSTAVCDAAIRSWRNQAIVNMEL
ncbi:MAG: Gfo/Idh/MocA family oxidoreductase [Bryobacteraceae bacterium]|jgi:predicted dehydrogenase